MAQKMQLDFLFPVCLFLYSLASSDNQLLSNRSFCTRFPNMSSGLDAGAGSYDEESYADGRRGEGLQVQGGSQDFSSKHSEGLQGGTGGIDEQRGLGAGLDGGSGDVDGHTSGFNAGQSGARPGGGVTLDGGRGDVDENGANKVTDLADRLKSTGSDLKAKMSSN
ncbi:unnamed protein product [Jaminaea pallidilutea]